MKATLCCFLYGKAEFEAISMFQKRIRSIISTIMTALMLWSTCLPSHAQEPNGVGSALGGLVGGILGVALGVGSYKQTPSFRQNVLPYIKEMTMFDAFMAKYNYQNRLSEKDEIDLIIKLGIPKYHPQWLTRDAITKIEKYYPGAMKRKAHDPHGYVQLASLCDTARTLCAYEYEYQVAIAGVDDMAIFLAIGATGIAVLTLNGLNKSGVMKSLNPDPQQLIANAEKLLCSEAGIACSAADSPPVPPTTQPGTSTGGGYGDCSAVIQNIYSVVFELKARYSALLEDKYKLPAYGKMSIGGHQQQFQNKQAQLRKLLNAADAAGCKGYPPDAWNWATTATPSPR